MDLLELADGFSHVRALVVGDLMLDRFLYGTVDRISPEAPVPVFKLGNEKSMLGGAGNVAVNLATLGCKVFCAGLVGEDSESEQLIRIFQQYGCQCELFKLPGYQTIVKTRMIASHNQILRADREVLRPDLTPILDSIYERIEALLPQVDIVLLSDYAKGMLTEQTTPRIIELCRRVGKSVIIDPKGHDYTKYSGATLVKPNRSEFQDATGLSLIPTDTGFYSQVVRGAKDLFHKYQFEHLIVTLSEYGMLHIDSRNPDECTQIPTEAKEVFDVSGAGDTSFATLGAALGAGGDYDSALKLANIASGIVVGKLGTSAVTLGEIREKLGYKAKRSRLKNVVTKEEILSILAPLRAQGKKIGFTNGCFDCLHRGHLASFARAKAECDLLVVGVNSDKSVKSYKGPGRPIQDEQTRAAIVASLKCVDYVILFDDSTAEPLVDLIRPDVIAKEGYTLEHWPEARKVVSYGGRAVVLERLEGISTTDLIQKIRACG